MKYKSVLNILIKNKIIISPWHLKPLTLHSKKFWWVAGNAEVTMGKKTPES